MSNALALAAVTAVFKDLLETGLVEQHVTATIGTQCVVSALSPDMVPLDGERAVPRLNVFLYRVTPNTVQISADLPSRSVNGNPVTSRPLALDLHYLLTAYGTAELEAEVLLGYGLQRLHQHPVLTRATIRSSLTRAPVLGAVLPPVYQALQRANLAEQIELIKITPYEMTVDDMSRLWSALQTRYRPTVAFRASAEGIEATQLKLLRINLSAVASQYIGETE